MTSSTFCVLPWMHLATNASGNLRVCCNSTPGKNFITRSDGSPYKLYRDDLTEAWNSKVYTTIRQQMIDDEQPDMCQRCFREEAVGLKSPRQAWNQKWQQDREYTPDAPFEIKYVDLRLGNLCNLKCRMCNPYASNQWVQEWELIETALDSNEKDRLSNMNWPEREITWQNLFSIANTIEEIYLTGGEPTIIKEQHRLLDYFINNGTAHNIKLKYNTNLTNVPRHLLTKWVKFKQLQLNCSIDAIGALNKYIRYPSNWSNIERNFKTVRQLPNANIEIHSTVQMYNILKLTDLIEWAKPYKHKIYFNILNHPDYLNIRCLPSHLKAQVTNNLQPYQDLDRVTGIIDYMNAEDWSDKLPEFSRCTHALDESRDENILDHIPEFVDYV